MPIQVNSALYRGGATTSSHLTAAQSANARALQSSWASMYGVWYRAAPTLRTASGKAKKPKTPKVLHQKRHGAPMAAGATRDPFKHRGAISGF